MNRIKRLLISMLTLLCCCTGAWAEGELNGLFTINASGSKVQFSQGNLQYFCSTTAPEWRFAEHQYDYVTFDGSAYAENSGKWIDLFGYGTSGYNNGQTCYQPYSTSLTPSDYYTSNLTGNADWGYNAISNGGNAENIGWRTLTSAEWIYLFDSRTNAASKYGQASINGINGMILLPDSWTLPDGLSFTPGKHAWETNTYTIDQWTQMENAGAVFLPASGSRNGTIIPSESTQNYNGLYRSSTAAYYLCFKNDFLQKCTVSYYQYGDAVRLVKVYSSKKPDSDGFYLIGTLADWREFAAIVEATPTANARLTADIDLGNEQTVVTSNTFQGIFDGQGHTMTVNLTSTRNYYGLFCGINGATIKNLHVTGTITTSHRFTGGIVGESSGTSNISNCWSSVTLNSSYSGDAVRGGLVGDCKSGSTLNISDCIFDGVFEGANSYTWGGLVGWKYGSVNINNCLFNPASVNIKVTDFATFSSNGGTVTNSYYTQTWNNSDQGTHVSAGQLANGSIAYRLQAHRADLAWGQRIGTDAEPVLTNDESYRVYNNKNGGYTNDPTLAYEGLQQDADGNYLIGSLADWQEYAVIIDTTPTANAKMTADIDLGDDQTKIASGEIYYQGTFDGQGYSLTIAYLETDGSSGYIAPFVKIQNATIKNLHVKGSINTAGRRPAGITSYVSGTCYVRNCWSEVDITSSYNGEIGAGGLVAWVENSTHINMDDCIFTGSITFNNSNGYRAGGLIGYCPTAYAGDVKNCLSAPSNLSTIKVDNGSNRMLVSNYKLFEDITITNCYYSNVGSSTNWKAQGKEVTSVQLTDGSLAYMLQAFRDQLNWGQKLGTDAVPVPIITDDTPRVYRAYSGGFTNASAEGYVFHQDTDGYFPIGSLYDWQDLAIQVELTPNTNAKMTEDIDLGDDQTTIPTYQGIFDGQGHTLTVNLTATSSRYGPFHALNRGTIKNLHVTGTITTSYSYVGGIVGLSMRNGTNTLINCWSSVTLKSTTSGENYIGGLVGVTDDYDTLNMSDCLFDGSFDGPNTSKWGGFVGLNYYSTVNISNSLFAPASVYIKDGLCTFSNNWGGSTQTNCFTSVPGNTTQGLLVTEEQMTSGNVAYLLQKGRNDLIWAQEIGSDTHPHPLPFSDNSSRVYSAAGGGYTNDPAQAGSDLVFDFTIVDNGDITIKGFRSDFTPPSDYALDIPDEIGGYPVIAIADNAFKQKSTITSLNIGRNVQSIGVAAFQNCTGLQSVEIPNTVTSLGDYVFDGCTSMSSVTFEEGCQLTSLPYEAFYNCSSLNEIVIPSSVTSIDSYAFQKCNSLTSLTIPVNVISLGTGICANTTNLSTLDLSKATQIAALYSMTSINRNSGIFSGLSANCDVILPYGCQATGSHVIIVEPDDNSIGIADDGYYELSKPEHWKVFGAIAQAVPTANARLTADIDLGGDQSMIGSESTPYQGIFDGQRHSLTMAYVETNNSATFVAPFMKIKNATIQNLHLEGSITTAGVRPAGITSFVTGICNINNCWNEVNIVASQSSWVDGGSFVGRVDAGQTLNMSDCVFTGSITLSNSNGYEVGGFVGWTQDGGIVNVQNCLFAPSSITSTKVSTSNKMLVNGYDSKITITNCYYKHVGSTSNWVAQGTEATAKQLADGSIAYKLQAGRENLVWGQRIGTDNMPLLTNVESNRVYLGLNGSYTNDSSQRYAGLQQDEYGYYLIGTVWDWQEFAALVNGGTNPTANAKMTADIDLGTNQTMVGNTTNPYAGTFDGCGHIMTISYNVTEDYVAPFRIIGGATIQNLHVYGTINTTRWYAGGIAGNVSSGTNYIRNTFSSISITGNYTESGNQIDWFGGLVGQATASGTELYLTDCFFNGSITGSNPSTSYCANIIGIMRNSAHTTISNCLSVGTFTGVKAVNSMYHYIYGSGSTTNSYVLTGGTTTDHGTAGAVTKASDLADGTITTALQAGRSEVVWVQDPLTNQPMLKMFSNTMTYTVPSSGIGTFSAKAKFAVPEGLTAYYCQEYNSTAGTISVVAIDGAVPANTGVVLKGTSGETYTLTGTNAAEGAVTDNALVAVTEETHIDQTSGGYVNFGLSGGVFKKVNAAGGTVKANRAYLRIPEVSLVATANSIAMVWDDDVTAVEEIPMEADAKTSVSGVWYDITGRKLSVSSDSSVPSVLPKGVYIVNGKKVLIK